MTPYHLPSRLTPLAAASGYRPLYGDIHNHCAMSYGHGTLVDALERARRQLDFVSVTGHAYWPDMPVDDPRVAHIVAFHVEGFARLRKLWPDHFATLRAYDVPGGFTVFPGYEIHSCAHGDYTIVYRDLDARELVLADDPESLKADLQAAAPDLAFAFPHHIGYRRGARGINWDTFDPALSPVVEMMSMHGCSETCVGDRPFLHSMGPSDARSTMQHGLAAGHVFGIIANSDHHSAFPGSHGHGRTCVYATENDRDRIWQAIMDRRTNALTGDRIHLFTTIGEACQGEVIAPASQATLSIEAVAGGFIDTIDVIRNGRLFARITPDLAPAPITADDGSIETILVLELGWGARSRVHRWQGHLEIEGGTLFGAEPRLSGPEIVSPLEGKDDQGDLGSIVHEGNRVTFDILARGNPNNRTPATQAVALHVRLTPDAVITADFDGQGVTVTAARLLEGALSGNLGPIDSPAYRFHPLPLPRQWQWQGTCDLGALADGENVYVRVRQATGQLAWSSPIFARRSPVTPGGSG